MSYARTLTLILATLSSATLHAQSLQEGRLPETGIVHTVPVGGVIHESFQYKLLPAYEITGDVNQTVSYMDIVIPNRSKLIKVKSKVPLKACLVKIVEDYDSQIFKRCLLDDDGDGVFDRIAPNDVAKAFPLDAPIPYKSSETKIIKTKGDFRKAITFLGVSNDTIRLSYREFLDDVARPAFTEEYTFPLSPSYPQVIAFKDIKMKVLGIDGAGIRYSIEP